MWKPNDLEELETGLRNAIRFSSSPKLFDKMALIHSFISPTSIFVTNKINKYNFYIKNAVPTI